LNSLLAVSDEAATADPNANPQAYADVVTRLNTIQRSWTRRIEAHYRDARRMGGTRRPRTSEELSVAGLGLLGRIADILDGMHDQFRYLVSLRLAGAHPSEYWR
jgi:hypothetical protein